MSVYGSLLSCPPYARMLLRRYVSISYSSRASQKNLKTHLIPFHPGAVLALSESPDLRLSMDVCRPHAEFAAPAVQLGKLRFEWLDLRNETPQPESPFLRESYPPTTSSRPRRVYPFNKALFAKTDRVPAARLSQTLLAHFLSFRPQISDPISLFDCFCVYDALDFFLQTADKMGAHDPVLSVFLLYTDLE